MKFDTLSDYLFEVGMTRKSVYKIYGQIEMAGRDFVFRDSMVQINGGEHLAWNPLTHTVRDSVVRWWWTMLPHAGHLHIKSAALIFTESTDTGLDKRVTIYSPWSRSDHHNLYDWFMDIRSRFTNGENSAQKNLVPADNRNFLHEYLQS